MFRIYIILKPLRLRINIFAVVAAALLFYIENPVTILVLFAAALLHEFGHFAAIIICGGKIKRIDIEPFGATVQCDTAMLSYGSEFAIALSGPATGAAAAVLSWALFSFYPSALLLLFIMSNIALTVINLVPFKTMDGGAALRALLLSKTDPQKAERIQNIVSAFAAAFLFALSFTLLYLSRFNISLMVLTVFQLIILTAGTFGRKRAKRVI